MPTWEFNADGSRDAAPLGNVKLKPVNWDLWLPSVHQLCMWMGGSKPSHSSQLNQACRAMRLGKGKGKNRSGGKGKANTKGTQKGKDRSGGKGEGKHAGNATGKH